MRGFQHRLTTDLARQYRTVAIEDTAIRNMTRSAKGTVENPGSQVKQKARLNRSILYQGWYGIRSKLEYKCQWHGRTFVAVPAGNTSRTCSRCGYSDPANRQSQASFYCQECGFQSNADINAAENIRRQGLALARAENGPKGLPGRAAGRPLGETSECWSVGGRRCQPDRRCARERGCSLCMTQRQERASQFSNAAL